MPLDKGKLQKLYSTLQKGGYSQSYDEFEKGFTGNDNYPNRKKVYDLLTEHGADIGNSYEDFMKKMYTPATKPKPQPARQQRKTAGTATGQWKMPVNFVEKVMQSAQYNPGANNPRNTYDTRKKVQPQPQQPKFHAPGYETDEEKKRQERVMRLRRDQLDYIQATGKPLENPIDIGMQRDENGNVVTAPLYAPSLERDGDGNVVSGENGEPIIGMDTDNNAREAYRISLQEKVEADKRREELKRQLEEAYKTRDELDEKLRARRKELEDTPWWQKMLAEMGKAAHSGIDPNATANDPEHMGYENDEEYMQLMSAARKNHQTIQTLEDKRDGKMDNFWHALNTTATNGYTFNDGLPEMRDVTALNNAKKHIDAINRKRQKGLPLTREEQVAEAVLKANETDDTVQSQYGADYGKWSRAGGMMANSIDFMKDFLLFPGGEGMAKAIAGKIAGVGGKILAKAAGDSALKATSKMIARATLKATGVLVGAHATGGVISNTTAMGRTAALMGQKAAGNVTKDENGNYKIENEQGLMQALASAEREQMRENGSEMAGVFLPGGKLIGGIVKRGLERIGLSKVSNFLTQMGGKEWYKRYSQFLKTGGYNGIPGEAFEEYEGELFDALTGHADDAWKDFTDAKQNTDIWLGCATMGALMGAIPMGLHMGGYYKFRHDMNKADKVAAFRLTKEKWEPLKEELDNTDNSRMANVVTERILMNNDLNPQEKKAALEYVRGLTSFRGFNIAQVSNAGDEESQSNQAQNAAYATGYETTDPAAMNDVKNRAAEAQQKLDDIFGEHTDANQILNAKNEDGTPYFSANDRKVAQDVVNAQQEYEGMLQRVRDDIDDEVQQTGAIYDSRTNDQGVIQSATLKAQNPDGTDKKVYITSGNIVMTDDGKSVDKQKSDMSIVVVDEDGKVQMISPDELFSMDAPIDGDQAKQQAIDAIQQSKAQEAADKINGKVNLTAGYTYILTDNTGQQIEATIVADGQTGAVQNPDGTVNVSMNGKVVAMDVNTLQQMVDNTNMQKAEQGLDPRLVSRGTEQGAEDSEGQEQPTEQEGDQGILDQGGTVVPDDEGSGAVPTYPGSVVAPDVQEPHQWQVDDTFTIDNGGMPVRGQVTGVGADGVEIYTESPVNGKKMQVVSPEELQSMATEVNGETVQTPQDEAAAEQRPTEPSPTEQNTGNGTDGVNGSNGVNGVQTQEQAPQAQEQAPQQTEGQPQRAIDRIPSQQVDDGKGNVRTVHNWEQAEPGDTYDALTEIYHGNADRVKKGIDNRVGKIDKAIKGVQKKMDAIDNSDDFDEVAAQSEQYDQLQQQKDELEKQKKYWQGVQRVPSDRKAEEARKRDEAERAEREARKAEEERKKAEEEEKARREREALNGVPDWGEDTPKDARARGFRRSAGHKYDRQQPVEHVQGKQVRVKFADKVAQDGHVGLMEAEQVQPSHQNGQPNVMHFLPEAQPKKRTDTASMMSADDIAGNINPEEITSSVIAYTGAPSVNARGEAIQGNNRLAALRTMWESHPEQGEKYKRYLMDHAADFGLERGDIEKMRHPVLVNVLDVNDDEAIRLGQYDDKDITSGGVERIKPKNAVQRIGKDMNTFANMLLRSSDDEASFSQLVDRNGGDVLKWMQQKGYITPTQLQSAFDSKGNVSAEASNDLKGILYQSIFTGGSERLEEVFNRLPAKAQRAILATGFRDYNSPQGERMVVEIQNSIMAFGELMHDDAFSSATNFKDARKAIEMWKRQYQLDDVTGESFLPTEKYSNFALHLAAMYKGNTQGLIQATFNQLYDLIQGTQEADLLNMDTLDNTPRTLSEAIKETLNIDYNGKQRSNVLAGNDPASQERKQGGPGESEAGGGTEAGNGPANGAGGTESHDEEDIDKGAAALQQPTQPSGDSSHSIGATSSSEKKETERQGVNTEPSEKQKEAGNYKKGHIKVDGYDITIENPKGSTRSGKDASGKAWSVPMHYDYGYIKGTEGVDGDHIDVYLSDNPTSGNVYVVDQIDQTTGKFDEHKVMYGFPSKKAAVEAYKGQYEKGWKVGTVTEVSREDFKKWVESSKRKTKPFSEYKSVKEAAAKRQPTQPNASTERTEQKQNKGKTEKPEKGNAGQFGLVSDERMEELKKRLRAKLNNLNMGVDPEVLAIGLELTAGYIDRGVKKFADYSKAMINDLGDVVRPYLKAFYNGVRDMPEITSNGLDAEMDDYETVSKFNVATIGKEGEEVKPSILDTAEQVSNESHVERQAEKQMEMHQVDVMGLMADLSRGRTTSLNEHFTDNDADADIKAAHDNMMKQLDKLYRIHGRQAIEGIVKDRDNIIDFYKGKLDRGETQGEAYGSHAHVDYARSLARAIGEREAAQEFMDNGFKVGAAAMQRPTERSNDSSNSSHSGNSNHSDDSLVEAAKETGHLVVGGVPKSEKKENTRYSERGYTLRPATEEDVENNRTIYVDGKRTHIVMVVRKGEQVGAAQFSKPEIEAVYTTDNERVPLSKIEVEDLPTTVHLKTAGDFYEAYGNDAVALGEVTGVSVVTRKDGTRMAGFPKKMLDEYEQGLRNNGWDVSVDGKATKKATENILQQLQSAPKARTSTNAIKNAMRGKKSSAKENTETKKTVSSQQEPSLFDDLFGGEDAAAQQQPTEQNEKPRLISRGTERDATEQTSEQGTTEQQKPAVITTDDEKGKEKPIETKPAEELSGDSKEYQERAKAEQEFVERIKGMITEAAKDGRSLTMSDIKRAYNAELDSNWELPNDYKDTDLQELVERAMTLATREVSIGAISKNTSEAVREGYDKVVKLYEAQPSLNARDSSRVAHQQYSTPTPFGYLMDWFLRNGRNPYKGLEPSAGNGALTIGFPAVLWHVNDIDERRLMNLRTMPYGTITNQDGTMPFEPKAYNMVATNPPFGSTQEKEFDGGRTKISSLEGLMAINALASMKDDGRAAIIIGGNTQYMSNGAMQAKDMKLFRHLYTHYNVVDVINLDGDMYKRNGTGYNVRMILIAGRKTDVGDNPEKFTYPPVKKKARAEQVKTFDELYKRVEDDIQQAKQMEREPSAAVNSDGSQPVNSASERTGNREAASGVQQQPVRAGEMERRPQSGRTVRPSSAQDGRGNGERGQHGSADRLDHADQRNAGSNHAVSWNGPTQGQSSEWRESGSTGRGPVGGTERGRAAQRNNTNGERPAVEKGAAAMQQPTQPATPKQQPESRKPREKVALGQEKVAYPAKSQSMTLQSRVPAAQAEAIAENLDKLGDVDEMVRSELGYSSKDELYSHLAAEQIDSVALAINQMKQGKGFIIGDMTGVGKGRQGAALIRWAIRQGCTPIYFTQKPTLFTDNYRDMCDIGSKGLHPFLIASKDDGNIVENVLDENGQKTYDKNGDPITRVVYGLPKPKERERVYNYILQNGKLPPEYDYVLVTYSQIQSGTKTYEIGKNGEIEVKDKKYKGKKPTGADTNGDVRRDVLEKLAKDNYVFLDESHTVGGQSSSGLYMQDMLKGAEGVTYLSATFAKRPDNMPLYAMKTAMSESGLSQKDMIDAIQNGGVTLQEIMSKQLVQSGQMIRRERDFSGVSIDWEGVDEGTDQQQRAQFDEVAKIFNAIREFQDNYVDPSIEKMSEDMAEEGKFSKKTQGTSHMGVNNVPFASKMYNLVNQLLFSLKANVVADKAIECLKKGEKPVISFNNTMEGFLDDMPRNTPMPELPNFSLTLMRALEGTLRYTEGEVGNKDNQVNKTLNINDLGDEAVAKYNEIRKTILNLSIGLPIDPMDAIKMRIEAAGYKVGEITGRKSEMVKDADGNYIVQSRTSKEMDGKAAASAFNSASGKNGGLDVLLINKSGSTGISLHASSKFTDQSPRVMIAAQFQSDINDEVQMRGRIDRTGQVHRGRYIYLVSSIPAEQRLQMMFKNKLKSLDANTTSSQKSKFNEMEVTDFMNKYGDEVTWSYMMEHPDLEERLGDPLDMLSDESKKSNRRDGDEENNQNSGCAGKILRRLPFLSVKEQEQIFNDLADAYKVKMQILNDAGENDLEITTMPLRAETKSRKVWKQGSDPDSGNAFADNTYLETAEVDVLKKPMKAKEVREYADRLTDGKPWEQWHQEQHEAVEQFYADKAKAVEDKAKADAQKRIDKAREDYIKGCLKARKKGDNNWSDEEISHMADIAAKEAADKEQTKINNRYISIDAQRNDVLGALDAFTPLEPLIIPLNLKDTSTTVIPSLGTFLGIKFGKGYSRSSSTAVFATLDGRRKIEVPLSDKISLENIKHQSVMLGYQARGLNKDNWDSKVPTKSRKTAYIVTGNLMQALVDTQKSPETKGQLISYTTIDGDVKQGILMNDRFKEENLKTSVPISSMLQKIIDGDTVESADKEVKIERGMSYHYNDFKLSVPKSKSRGGKYFLDKKLLRLLEDEFTTSGSNMTAWVSQQNLKKVLDYLSKALGVTVQVKANLEETADSPHNDEPATPSEAEEGGVLYREVDDEEAARLDSEPTVKVYRAMQEHDGKLYPPMSGRVKTQVETKKGTMRTKWVWRSPIEIGKWEQSEEHPEMANEDGTFTLDKGNGSTINAAYNPYIHTSRTPINDQFSSAWNRPELVTVEVEVPVSELTSGYHAEKAKDSTGEVEWKSGPVGREMAAQGNPRMVILSRWDKPVRIVPVDEVADEYAVRLAGTGIKVPFNTVPPALRDALVARGVEISEPEKGNAGQASRPSYEEWLRGDRREREGDSSYTDEELSMMNDPVAKMLGANNRTAKQRKAFAARERRNMETAVRELAEKLHLDNVEIVTEPMAIKDKRGKVHHPKGYFDKATGKIVVCIGNNKNAWDVMQTVLHEAVGHYGLRRLFGKHFDTFLENVYAAADMDVRRKIAELAIRKYGGNFHVATEEYLATLAEDTNFDSLSKGFWPRIKQLFLRMIRAIGLEGFADRGVTLSDNELRYILWRSYKNLTAPGEYRSFAEEAEDVAKQAELKVGDFRLDEAIDQGASPEQLAVINRIVQIGWLTKKAIDTFRQLMGTKRDLEKAIKENATTEKTNKLRGQLEKLNETMDDNRDWAEDLDVDLRQLLKDNGIKEEDLKEYDGMLAGEAKEAAVVQRQTEPKPEVAEGKNVSEPAAWGKKDMLSKAEQISHGIEPDLLFRDTIEDDDNTARETYNRMADEAKSRIREAWQDSMINVRNLQQAVLEQRGEKLEDYEDAYNAENRSHGKSRAESEYFTDNLYKPLLKAVDDVAKAAKVSVGDVTEYMMAKHGLERNIVFARRDADAAYKKAYDEAKGKYDALMNASRAESDPKKADALEKAANKVKFPDYDDIFNHLRMRDYAGLTSLTGQSDVLDAEAEAQRIVNDMESRVASIYGGAQDDPVSKLWKATNAATKWTLKKGYESGIISKDNYNYVSGMFNYYVPLRGWQEDTAGDLFDYVGSGDKGTAFSPTLHKAKGRRSEADNPIAYIGNMAVSAIVQGNKNKVKQTFLGFVENHPTNLVTVSEMWYRNFGTDTDPDWREDVPNIPEDATADEVADIVKQHEDIMEQLKDLGKATKKRGRLHLGVPVKRGQALEHHVEVLVNGKKYVLYINGNPRAAQALNGTRQRRASERSFESGKVAVFGRKLAERYTSLSPSFTVSNAFRDLTMAAISTAIKESPAYALRFRLNVAKLGGPARMFTLMKWYNDFVKKNGVDGANGLNGLSDTQRYFYEFMTHGAETGFTSLKEIDEYKDEMLRMYKNMNQKLLNPKRLFRGLSEGLEYTNRCIEDMTRFAIYMASRQSGRSVRESTTDAKNITLNFNRKGSGEMGNATYRNLQIFVNPAIQSLQNVASMAMEHPVKFTLYTGIVGLIGAGQVFATQLLWSLFGGGDGDDDGNDDGKWNAVDEYWKLPTWQRRNNLVMWIPGTKKFAMIPLAQEFRVFHGFGETLMTTMLGKSDENAALELMSQVGDLLPLDFAGNNGNMLINLAPTVMQPLLQVGFNTDFTGRPLYKDNDFNKYEPSFQKAYVGTPSWLIKSSEFINDITGGDDHMQGWWERTKVGKELNNPAVVDHILKGYYGGMYSFLAQLGGTMYTLGTGNMPDAQEVPVVNRVITAPRETEQGGKQKLPDWYYDLSEENARQQNEFSGYKKDYMKGDAAGKKKFIELINSKDFQKWQEVNTYIGAVQQIRTAMNYTKDPNEKAELEKSLAEVLGELKKMKDE